MKKEDCLTRAVQYEKNDRFMEYAALYHRLWGSGRIDEYISKSIGSNHYL